MVFLMTLSILMNIVIMYFLYLIISENKNIEKLREDNEKYKIKLDKFMILSTSFDKAP